MAQNLPIPVVFVPGRSFFHRLHPLTKLLWAVVAIVLGGYDSSRRSCAILGEA